MGKQIQKSQANIAEQVTEQVSHVASDLKNSILVVSLLANLTIFILWVALQVSSRYDDAVATFLFK